MTDFKAVFREEEQFTAEFGEMYRSEVNEFDGEYEYTPTNEVQTINIEGMIALDNITINPIPSNYGLITWNGSVLTVS